MKMTNIREIKGRIRVLSGLHIGAGKGAIEIGGLDQPIIKDPLTDEPYIPGSSIKGKMRSLLEVFHFTSNNDTLKDVSRGKPCQCGKKGCPACTIFGAGGNVKEEGLGPTRLVVRDARLNRQFRDLHKNGDLPMEVKYENVIHRVKGVAEHPRPLERVPAGVEFDFTMSFKVFEDDPENMVDWVFKGLNMIMMDALGGNSSRGCGQVEFSDVTIDDENVDLGDARYAPRG
jgi:CRISPR-associated protein Csm3